MSIPVYWDETLISWARLGVRGQPTLMLFDGDGTVLGAWAGGIPDQEVLDLIA